MKKLSVCVLVIPQSKQRYNTIGDWWLDEATGILEIRVSDMGNWKYEHLVSVHEYLEALLCLARGIKEADVTAFDLAFEKRPDTKITDEPGDDVLAPYFREHQFATSVEKYLASELKIDWHQYSERVTYTLISNTTGKECGA